MPKNQKKLYIVILIILVLFTVAFFIYPKDKKTEALLPSDGSKASVFDETIITIPLRTEVGAPLLDQGGESLPVQARGGNSLESKSISIQETPANTESVTILAGEVTARFSFIPNATFYDALVQARNEEQISFDGKNYPGLGFFVNEIGTLHAGGGKYLLYYINGTQASVGVSSYTLQDGDIIEWKLE